MSVAIVSTKLTCGSETEEVVAVYTTACGISSMSERLAQKLGVVNGQPVHIRNAGPDLFGHLPDKVVYVECAIHRASVGRGVISVPVAFLIMPDPYNELVLGGDWSRELELQESQMATVFGGTDSMNMPDTTYMRIHFGTPTRGPGYSPEIYMSLSHQIEVGRADKLALKKLVNDEKDEQARQVSFLTVR